ncbi:hypothetical protein BC832DRAFT_162911 [Gaertneriomyces semiglobifer]|nr:hypothetical protein BC832DRAFT_162911 [Gaertneriomyces semiglobifer]
MIFVFIIDTSASMNRIFSGNLTFLESAKSAVEHFFKWENTSSHKDKNKYMLVTYEEQQYRTLADTHDSKTLLQELKNLQAHDLSTAGTTFAALFEYLDVYRLKNGMDSVGRGRYIADIESTTIFWFTDAYKFVTRKGEKWVVENDLHIPRLRTPGNEFYLEPFRWDQRLYTLWMTHAFDPNSRIPTMSGAMGSQWWQIPNVQYLMHCVDNCVRPNAHPNVHPLAPVCNIDGVVLWMTEHPDTFTPTRELPSAPSYKLLVYKSSTRHFPIPEPYWIDEIRMDSLIPQRTAHPRILFTKRDDVYPIPEGFPVDRFNIDQSSPLAQELMKAKTQISWALYMENSSKSNGYGAPFGTLKFSSSTKTVSMYIMPYDFPRLFKLILQVRQRGINSALPSHLLQAITDYIQSVPKYYLEPLKKAFGHINLLHLWPSDVSSSLNAAIEQRHTDAMTRGAAELTRIQEVVAQMRQRAAPPPSPPLVPSLTSLDLTVLPRTTLLPTLTKLTSLFFPSKPTQADLDSKHSLPISQMGLYQTAMAKQQRLRDPMEDEDEAKKRDRNVFGNPYRADKRVGIDEEDEASQIDISEVSGETDSIASGSSTSSTRRRRKLRSQSPHLRYYDRRKLPRISPSPAPIFVRLNDVSWKDIKSGCADIEGRRKKAEADYIAKHGFRRNLYVDGMDTDDVQPKDDDFRRQRASTPMPESAHHRVRKWVDDIPSLSAVDIDDTLEDISIPSNLGDVIPMSDADDLNTHMPYTVKEKVKEEVIDLTESIRMDIDQTFSQPSTNGNHGWKPNDWEHIIDLTGDGDADGEFDTIPISPISEVGSPKAEITSPDLRAPSMTESEAAPKRNMTPISIDSVKTAVELRDILALRRLLQSQIYAVPRHYNPHVIVETLRCAMESGHFTNSMKRKLVDSVTTSLTKLRRGRDIMSELNGLAAALNENSS